MLGFIMKIDAIVKVAKNQIKLRQVEAYKRLQQRENVKRVKEGKASTQTDGVEDENEAKMKSLEKEVAENRFKLLLRWFISAIIGFFEALPIYITLFMSVLVIVVVVGVVIMLVSVFMAIQGVLGGDGLPPSIKPPVTEGGSGSGSGGVVGNAEWTLEELATRGGLLTDYEKNLYRAIVLSKQTVDGTFGDEKWGEDTQTAMTFLLGITSIETGMQFYSSSKDNRDILKYPSDKVENSLGYGCFGMHKTDILSKKSPKMEEKIKSMYQPSSSYAYEIRYAPYGLPMSGSHFKGKMVDYVWNDTCGNKIEKVMTSFGIQENRTELKTLIEWCIGQAQYHGAEKVEHEEYAAFICAMWVATSDVDAERSMDAWGFSTGTGYSESGVRHCFVGSYGAQDIEKNTDFSQMKFSSKHSSRPTLHGKSLPKPVWGYLHDKFYGKNQYFTDAEELVKKFGGMVTPSDDSGKGMRVLNFHYGINSYMQGSRIIKDVSGKLTGKPSGGGSNDLVGDSKKAQLVDYAKRVHQASLEGKVNYVFGGGSIAEDGDSFKGVMDCSKYMQFIFKKMGVDIPRDSRSQYRFSNQKIKKADLEPCDLVFFGSGSSVSSIYHVGMYIGNNEFIHIYQAGKPSAITLLNEWDDYYGAVRINLGD